VPAQVLLVQAAGMPCVAIKLGGGLITRKSSLCAPDAAAIEELAAAIAEVHVG